MNQLRKYLLISIILFFSIIIKKYKKYKKYIKQIKYKKKYIILKKIKDFDKHLTNIDNSIFNLNKKIHDVNNRITNLYDILKTYEKEHHIIPIKINDDFIISEITLFNLLYIFGINKSISIKIDNIIIQDKNIGKIIYIKNISNYDVYLLSDIDIYVNTYCIKVNKYLIRPFSIISLILLEINFFVILKSI